MFSYIGARDSPLVGCVLRARKAVAVIDAVVVVESQTSATTPALAALLSSLPLPGGDCTADTTTANVVSSVFLPLPPADWLVGLNAVLTNAALSRPPARRNTLFTTRLCGILTIAADACDLWTTRGEGLFAGRPYVDPRTLVSVEIKVKAVGARVDAQRIGGVCRFCTRAAAAAMGQKPLVNNDDIAAAALAISLHCPVKLFSRDAACVRAVLAALVQRPKNNLRVFINGLCVVDAEGVPPPPTSEPALDLALSAVGWSRDLLLDALTATLLAPQGAAALRALQVAQEVADERVGGPSGAFSTLKALESGAFVSDSQITALRDYVLSATAKDASIIIALGKVQNMGTGTWTAPGTGAGATAEASSLSAVGRALAARTPFFVPYRDSALLAAISVVDWDVKPLSRVERWARLAAADEEAWARGGAAVARAAGKVCGLYAIGGAGGAGAG